MALVSSSGGSALARLFGSAQSRELLEMIGLIFLLMVTVLVLVTVGIKLFRVVTREADSCPRCHGTDVRRSHYRSGPSDWMLARFGCAAMRCRNCHGRFYARQDDATPMRHRRQKAAEE